MSDEPRGINRRTEFEVTEKLAARFWAKVDQPSDGCWDWQGGMRNNYGAIKHGGKVLSAHRVAWILTNGHPPEGMLICHKCDNRACCRPDHLELGTPGKNNRDARGRRTFYMPRGEQVSNAVLTEADVLRIMSLRVEGLGARKIAREMGVREGNVKKVLTGETWTHITGGRLRAGKRTAESGRALGA